MQNSKALWATVLIASFCSGGLSLVFLFAGAMADPIPAPSEVHDRAVAAASNQVHLSLALGATCLILFVVSLVKLAMPARKPPMRQP